MDEGIYRQYALCFLLLVFLFFLKKKNVWLNIKFLLNFFPNYSLLYLIYLTPLKTQLGLLVKFLAIQWHKLKGKKFLLTFQHYSNMFSLRKTKKIPKFNHFKAFHYSCNTHFKKSTSVTELHFVTKSLKLGVPSISSNNSITTGPH